MLPVSWKSTAAVCVLIVLACGVLRKATGQEAGDPVLPEGVKAVWNLDRAHRESTLTRDRICINGLWRFKPALSTDEPVPSDGWGYVKVPGPWPRGSSYDKQRLYPHPSWQEQDLAQINQAWHQREVAIPAEWAGRRIVVSTEYLNSYAAVYVDGRRMGEIRFPWGEVDVTSACRPGGKHLLTLYVAAVPLKEVLVLYNQTDQSQQVKGSVQARGLCGDVFLSATPQGARVTDVKVETSVRKGELTVDVALTDLEPGKDYSLRALAKQDGATVKTVQSGTFRAAALGGGRYAFTSQWQPDDLWDTHTPENTYTLELSLVGAFGGVLDAYRPLRFGFRELWIDGRDFYLNGKRIYLLRRAARQRPHHADRRRRWPTTRARAKPWSACKSIGINFVYTHNYGCQPGTHRELRGDPPRGRRRTGMLIALSQPHARSITTGTPTDADHVERLRPASPSSTCGVARQPPVGGHAYSTSAQHRPATATRHEPGP